MLKGRVLLLNATYEILGTIGVARAIRMTLRKENPVTVQEYVPDTYLTSANGDKYQVPSVITLKHFVNVRKKRQESGAKRMKIYLRDKYQCFREGTQILMFDGSTKPIELCEVGDKVLDADGNIQTIEYVHSREHEGEMYSIYCRGNGIPVEVTPDHKMLSYDRQGNCEEVLAKDITTSHYFSRPIPYASNREEVIDLLAYCEDLEFVKKIDNKLKHYCGNEISRYVGVSRDFGRLMGYYLSEGSISGNSITFAFHANEKKYHEDVRDLVKNILGLDTWIAARDTNCTVVGFGSTIFRQFLLKTVYKGGDKRSNLFKNNKEYLEGLLCGVLRGDGTFNEVAKRVTLQMSRTALVQDLYLDSIAIGLNPTLSKVGTREDGRIYQGINFNALEYNKAVAVSSVEKENFVLTSNKGSDLLKVGNRVISKVTRIEKSVTKETVYDLQISGSHTFVAGGVCVHNCQYCSTKVGKKHPVTKAILQVKDLTLDHITPKSKGGSALPSNLVTACKPCNQRKADRTPEEAKMPLRTEIHDITNIGLDKVMICKYLEYRPEWLPYLEMQEGYKEVIKELGLAQAA